jgi:hypothetical protein
MNWLTTKAVLWVGGGMLLALLATAGWGAWERQGKLTARANERTAKLSLSIATTANQAATDMLAAMTKQRDDLLLKRATEQKQAEQAVAESRQVAVTVYEQLVEAKRQINAMSLHQGCKPILAAQVCPEVADRLRVP